MLTLTVAQIGSWMGLIWWPFCRAMGMFITLPLLSSKHIPVRVKILLALLLSVVASPLMPAMPQIEMASLAGLLLSAEQLLLGVLMAMPLLFLLQMMTVLGGILSMQMGLSMAIMNDPINGGSHALLGQWLLLYGSLLFISFDGHSVALQVFAASFHSWPVGRGVLDFPLRQLALQFGWMISAALLCALPAVVAMLLVNLTFGVMNRAASSFNIFALGFPMAMLMGLGSLAVTQQLLPARYANFSSEMLQMMQQLIQGGA